MFNNKDFIDIIERNKEINVNQVRSLGNDLK